MTDIPNRSELEAELARKFSKLSAAHRKELMELLGVPPNFGNVPQQFWQKVVAEMNGAFVPFLMEVYMQSAERLVGGLPVGVDWGLVNERAARWAQLHANELVRTIDTTTQRAIQQSISAYFREGMTREEIEAMMRPFLENIGRITGAMRAEMIAVTEVTRAASKAEQEIAEELLRQGIHMVPVWQTNNDELVCEICGPKHDEEITDNEYPPAHPRCRCWVNHELQKRD